MMNKKKTISLFIAVLMLGTLQGFAHVIEILLKTGETTEVKIDPNPIRNKGILDNNNKMMEYESIKEFNTSDFQTYDKLNDLVQKRKCSHIKVNFTGDENYYRLKLEQLHKQRDKAHVARGIGGLITLFGVISGDRRLTSAGIVTHGIGTISRDINQEKVMKQQSEMILELQEQKNRDEQLEQYRLEYGSENVEAYLALMERNYKRALAFANVGLTSGNSDYCLTSLWLKTLIIFDKGDQVGPEVKSILDEDKDIKNETEVYDELNLLKMKLEELRENV